MKYLLQGDLTKATGITSQDFIVYAVTTVIGLLVTYFLVQWFWGIGQRNRMMKVQVQLLQEIAKMSGVASDKIDDIITEAFPPKN